MAIDAVEPPIREQKTRRMIPGEDAPDCAHCGAGLHEARPPLNEVLDAVRYCEATKMLYGRIAVDCPACTKPNDVSWHVDTKESTWDATARTMWTKKDERYMRQTAMHVNLSSGVQDGEREG